MSEHRVVTRWQRQVTDFSYETYNRDHEWVFDRETRVCASASPEYKGNPRCVDPEQAFVASLSSCHMLTFLALCAKKQLTVNSYRDEAFCVLGRNDERKPAITRVELHPVVTFDHGVSVSDQEFHALHARAHAACFIANSIHTCVKVDIEPEMAT